MADPTTLQFEPTDEGNSLTSFTRSLHNLLGDQGQKAFDTGKSIYQSGVNNLDEPINFLKNILGGDRSSVQSFLGPQIDPIVQQFDQIRKSVAEGPRGGGTASSLVQQPEKETGLISNLISEARKMAVGNLSSAAEAKAKLGQGQQELGLNTENAAQAGALNMRSQDVSEHGQMLGVIGQILSQLIGGAAKVAAG